MMLLKIFELVFSVLYVAFLVTEIFIPLARSSPLFPTFRKLNENKKEK